MTSKELKKIFNNTRRTVNIELSVDQVKEIIPLWWVWKRKVFM